MCPVVSPPLFYFHVGWIGTERLPPECKARPDDVAEQEEAGGAPTRRSPKRESTGQLATLIEMVQEAEDARHVFVQCSGMHMPYVEWIIRQMCFRTWWVKASRRPFHSFSCAEFVVPALTLGIPEACRENLVAAQAEMAVYASLFLSGYVGMWLNGDAADPNTTDTTPSGYGFPATNNENLRLKMGFGFLVGGTFSIFNILCAVLFRFAGSFLPRESDKLVVMWSMRWLPPLNFWLFVAGIVVGLSSALMAGRLVQRHSRRCVHAGHFGEPTYMVWYFQWVRDSYPAGRGVVHPLGEPILNPWAVAAGAAGIARPEATYVPSPYISEQAEMHASFSAYNEFMQGHLGHREHTAPAIIAGGHHRRHAELRAAGR